MQTKFRSRYLDQGQDSKSHLTSFESDPLKVFLDDVKFIANISQYSEYALLVFWR